jgi:hypothetical protein
MIVSYTKSTSILDKLPCSICDLRSTPTKGSSLNIIRAKRILMCTHTNFSSLISNLGTLIRSRIPLTEKEKKNAGTNKIAPSTPDVKRSQNHHNIKHSQKHRSWVVPSKEEKLRLIDPKLFDYQSVDTRASNPVGV